MEIQLITSALIGGLLSIAVTGLAIQSRRQRRLIARTREQIESLASDITALCSGAVGVDGRVTSLERRGRDLEHRQESMESQKQFDRPYGEAIQLVHQGANAGRLVEELGLSHSEAELVVMLHSVKKAS